MHQIKISNILIDVTRKNIKNMRLTVIPPRGKVRISVPLYANDEEVHLFAISKLSWIKHHQNKFKEQERETKRCFVSNESHYIFGRPYLLDVVEHNAAPKVIYTSKDRKTRKVFTALDWLARLKSSLSLIISK